MVWIVGNYQPMPRGGEFDLALLTAGLAKLTSDGNDGSEVEICMNCKRQVINGKCGC